MKNLSEKFDQLPQDFDPELIWQGIEKPIKRSVLRRYILWIGLLFMTATALICRFSRQSQTAHESGAIAEVANAISTTPGINVEVYRADTTPVLQQEAGMRLFSPSNRNNKTAFIAGKNDHPLNKNSFQEYAAGEKLNPETLYPGATDAFSPDNPENAAGYQNFPVVHSLPTWICAVDFKREKPAFYTIPNIVVIHKKQKQSLALGIDIGSHKSSFEASSDQTADLRRKLETAQLDYGVSLRYEYLLRGNFLLSVSASYHLFKDKINTTYIRQSPDNNLLVDYRLHNHYHVVAGQLELGKRFFRRHFFWDVQGGIGLKLHQESEVDYFVSEEILADDTQISLTYRNNPDVFFTAQAALGKQLSQNTFVRIGAQVTPGLTLSSSQSDITHQIIPFRGFVMIGKRF